jgi:hypothetical protein
MVHYHFDETARRRLWFALQDMAHPIGGFAQMMEEAAHNTVRKYGSLVAPGYRVLSTNNPVMDHFFFCDDKHVLPFIEACFRSTHYLGTHDGKGVLQANGRAAGVEEINDILKEHGIGYRFTPFVETFTDKRGWFGSKEIDTQYPTIVVLDNEFTFKHAVKPAVELLHDLRFKIANNEFMKAYEDYRDGDLEHAMTACGSAFESVLKTICAIKAWTSDPEYDQKATLQPMVRFCINKKLFPDFYEQSFLSVATIRNRLSSAHGRGGISPPPTVTVEEVEHLLNLTAAHILLVIGMAKI